MANPHILAIPYPAQGHVIPLIELSLCLAKQGFRVTFVNTESNHRRILTSLLAEKGFLDDGLISLISMQEGLVPLEDTKDVRNFSESIFQIMPEKLEEIIVKVNANSPEDERIICVIADADIGFVLDVAEKMKIQRAVFWPAAVAKLYPILHHQKFIDDGIIDNDGKVLKSQGIELALSSTMPAMKPEYFFCSCFPDSETQKFIFHTVVKGIDSATMGDWVLCNSAYDLEPAAFDLVPKYLPVGPFLPSNGIGSFWPQDSSCFTWLDQQLPKSVIYVAFGSLFVFDKVQFQELALGLELSGKPFLWVVRSDVFNEKNVFPEGFEERIAARGRIVRWAPQQKVLSHSSVACFLSHCGWNSTMEGVGNGVPFLCWPFFGDQLLNENYICDVWKVGLKFNRNENGIISGEEIKSRVEQIFGDEK